MPLCLYSLTLGKWRRGGIGIGLDSLRLRRWQQIALGPRSLLLLLLLLLLLQNYPLAYWPQRRNGQPRVW